MSFLKGYGDEIKVPAKAVILQDKLNKIEVPFIAVFKRLTSDQAREARGRYEVLERNIARVKKDPDLDLDTDVTALQVQEVREYLVRWENLPGQDGKDVEYSEETLEEVLNIPPYCAALCDAFLASIIGKEALRRKN